MLIYAAGQLPRHVHDIDRGLVAIDPAKCSRTADAAADIGADAEIGQPRRQRCGRTTGRPARRPGEIPGIVRYAVDIVERLAVAEIERNVCRTQKDGAGFPKPSHRNTVLCGLGTLEPRYAPGARHALYTKTFLHIDRHTMQRPAGHIARDGLIRLFCALERTLAELIDVCVEFRLKSVDPAEDKLRQLDRRDRSATDRSRRIESGAKNRIKHVLCLLWVALQCQMSNAPCR